MQRVMVVEDDDAVEAVVLGDVRGGGRVFALDAAEHVGRGAVVRVAEGVAFGGGDLAFEVEADAGVEGARGAQLVEEGALQGDAVRDLHYTLGGYAVDRAEGLLDPGVHGLRWIEASRRRGDV